MIPYVFLYYLLIFPYLINIISSTPKLLYPYLYFKFAYFSNIIKLLFPFKYPITWATLYLGGIDNYICIWSGHASASIISIPLYWHNFLNITPISLFILPYITCLRYFGANTFVFCNYILCVKQSMSSFIDKTSYGIEQSGKTSLLFYHRKFWFAKL